MRTDTITRGSAKAVSLLKLGGWETLIIIDITIADTGEIMEDLHQIGITIRNIGRTQVGTTPKIHILMHL